MAGRSISFTVTPAGVDITAHRGVTPTATLCTPEEGEHYEEFLSLCWREWDQSKGVNSQIHVYLSQGEVEALRDSLTEQLEQMGK